MKSLIFLLTAVAFIAFVILGSKAGTILFDAFRYHQTIRDCKQFQNRNRNLRGFLHFEGALAELINNRLGRKNSHSYDEYYAPENFFWEKYIFDPFGDMKDCLFTPAYDEYNIPYTVRPTAYVDADWTESE